MGCCARGPTRTLALVGSQDIVSVESLIFETNATGYMRWTYAYARIPGSDREENECPRPVLSPCRDGGARALPLPAPFVGGQSTNRFCFPGRKLTNNARLAWTPRSPPLPAIDILTAAHGFTTCHFIFYLHHTPWQEFSLRVEPTLSA